MPKSALKANSDLVSPVGPVTLLKSVDEPRVAELPGTVGLIFTELWHTPLCEPDLTTPIRGNRVRPGTGSRLDHFQESINNNVSMPAIPSHIDVLVFHLSATAISEGISERGVA